MTTLLVAEHDNKTLKDATNKALTAAKAIGGDVHVLVAGKDCKAAAEAPALAPRGPRGFARVRGRFLAVPRPVFGLIRASYRLKEPFE